MCNATFFQNSNIAIILLLYSKDLVYTEQVMHIRYIIKLTAKGCRVRARGTLFFFCFLFQIVYRGCVFNRPHVANLFVKAARMRVSREIDRKSYGFRVQYKFGVVFSNDIVKSTPVPNLKNCKTNKNTYGCIIFGTCVVASINSEIFQVQKSSTK